MTRPYQRMDNTPVEFWPTSTIRDALQSGDITVWQRIVVAIKRDPYGRTARQVEEVSLAYAARMTMTVAGMTDGWACLVGSKPR